MHLMPISKKRSSRKVKLLPKLIRLYQALTTWVFTTTLPKKSMRIPRPWTGTQHLRRFRTVSSRRKRSKTLNNKRRLKRRDKSSRKSTMISLKRRDRRPKDFMMRSLRSLKNKNSRCPKSKRRTKSVCVPSRKLRIRHSKRVICFPRKSRNTKKSSNSSKSSFS